MSDGIFIKVLPQLELAAFTSVVTQLRSIMGKAGADMSKSFDGPQKALEALNAETVKTSNAVAAASEKMDALQVQAARSAEARANTEATASARQVKAANDVEAAELRLDATRSRNFASQENRMASLVAAQGRLDAAIARSEQVARDEALATAKAMDAESAAMGRLAAQQETLAGAQAAHAATLAKQTEALAASSTMAAKYGGAMDTAGMAAAGAFAVIGGVGLDAATKFETGMTRIQVAAQVSGQSVNGSASEIQKLSQGLLDMSSSMGESMGKLQEASLMIAKAGPQYKNAADNLKILHAGLELSKTEGADLTTVVQQMTTSMNDFNISADQSGNIAAKFQAAASNAKRPLEEFVGALHNYEPAAMGVLNAQTGLNEVLTTMSAMAGTGAGIDQASQNLNNFLSHLNVANAPQRSVLGSLGLDSTKMSEELKSPNGLITVLGELREAIAAVTTGTGDNAIAHLGEAFKNPQITKLMQDDYGHLSAPQKNIADRFTAANTAGIPVDKDTMRQMRAATGTSGLLKDWYTKFLQTTGPSNLVKQGLSPDMSVAEAVQLATGSQAGDRSFLGMMGDVTNPNDEHWANTKKTLNTVGGAKADPKGDIPGWSEVLQTNKQKLDELNGSLQKLAVEVGQDILPSFKSFVDVLTDVTKFLGDNKWVMDAMVVTLGAMATGWLALKASMVLDKVLGAMAGGLEMAIGKAGALKGAIGEVGAASVATATTVREASVAEAESLGTVKTAAIGVKGAVSAIGGAAKGALLAFLALKPFIDDWDKSLKDHKFDPANDPNHVYGNADGSMTQAQWEARAAGDADEVKRRHDWIVKNFPDETVGDELHKTFTAPWGTGKEGTPGSFQDYLDGYAKGGAIGPGGSSGPHGPMHSADSTAQPGDSNTPDGTPNDPVQVQIPGFDPSESSSFDPSQYASDLGGGMDTGDGGMGGMGLGAVTNPLEQLKGGGFTLPNIAKVLTTFLMEMALGNPLGHLLTGTNEFGDQQGGDGTGDPTSEIGDIDQMTAGQRKQREYELQTQGAIRRYKKAQNAFIQAITKYGRNSEQGEAAYANLLSAKDNVENVALHQTDAIQSGNAALTAAQATVQQDKTDMINVSDPAKYQSDIAKLTKIQNSLPSGGGPQGATGGSNNLSQDQIATAIIQEGLKRNLSRDQIVAGLNVAKLESNYGANPLSRVHQNQAGTDVEGIFQQDPGYSGDHDDPHNAAGQFFDRMLQRAHPGDSAGQQAVRVQVGTYGGSYVDSQNQGSVYDRLLATASGNGAQQQTQDPAATPGSPGAGIGGGGSILQNLLQQFLPGAGPGSNGPIFRQAPQDTPGPTVAQYGPQAPGYGLAWQQGQGWVHMAGPGIPLGTAPAAAPGATPGAQVPGAAPPPGAGGAGGGGGSHLAGSAAGTSPFSNPVTPSNTAGPIQSGSGSGVSVGGGMLGTAESLGAAALNALAPGAGIAAQIGMQELNNVASYVGKAAGIGVEGLQETFSVHSPDTNDGASGSGGWIGKIAGGLAGGHPQAQNTAGTAKGVTAPSPPPQGSPASGNGSGPAPGPTNNYNVTNNIHGPTDPQGVAVKTNQGLMQFPTTP